MAAALPVFCLKAGNGLPEKGFKALAIYDYFKARACFVKSIRKSPGAPACYGLALIFSRHDNPFSNSDSALKYANLAYNLYRQKPKKAAFSGFSADSLTILRLIDTIAVAQFARAQTKANVEAYDVFLTTNYLAGTGFLRKVVYQRDELEFNRVLQVNKSDSTAFFITTHPQSSFLTDALILKDRQLYDENTAGNSPEEYIAFIDRFPNNVMLQTAYERLFSAYRQSANVNGLALFVKRFPAAPQTTEAWKLLFSLTVKAYSFSELKRFLELYPDFPLRNSILKELELNKLVVYPYQQGDFTGFINEEGKFAIAPVYDAATAFSEGLSVVTKNDSVFYINKENVNPFDRVYSDAMVFKNGIAPVKSNSRWMFINRQGQAMPGSYAEISELSNSVYVVKDHDRYGALDQYGQQIIEPRFEKLGDFKNDYAYYVDDGMYGFISVSGTLHKAEFEWISDFDERQIAVFKQNGRYGLVNGSGKKLLDPLYDQITNGGNGIFIVVLNNQYGFFSSQGCFICLPLYDYQRDRKPGYYTAGNYFRLLKKGEQWLVDANGQTLAGTENYSEVNFLSDGLMRVQKKKKYGFVDRKLGLAIPFKYQEAGDFSDSLAVVKLKDKYYLIDTRGKEVFGSSGPLEKISARYYLAGSEPKSLVNNRGEVVLNGVISVSAINSGVLIITLAGGEIKLINDETLVHL